MTEPDKILVFIPAYNCERQIARVLAQFNDPQLQARFHTLLVLDNQSRDDTLTSARMAKAEMGLDGWCLIARNVENYGLGGSHKAAFRYAERNGFTHVVVLHGDDQGNIADLIPVLDRGDHRQADACLGSRFMRGSRLLGYSRFRIFGNQVFNALFTAGTGKAVLDLGSGLNIFGRAIVQDPATIGFSDDLRFNVFLLLRALDQNRKLRFFPISWREDDQVSNVKMASQAAKTLGILRDYIFRRAALRNSDHRAVARKDYVFEIVDDL